MDEQGFDRFWTEYPKKRSKGDAFKAWKAVAAKRPPIEKIMKALAVLKASDDWRKDSGQYIPYPGTWLRAWGWEDVPEVDLKAVLPDGRCWWQSVSGIEAKGKALGMEWTGEYRGLAETFQQFTKRLRALVDSGKVVPLRAA